MASNKGNPILIVEDEADAREALSEFLAAKGYQVACASNGLAAIDQIRNTKPVLILLDLNMPVMDGYTFLDQAQQNHLLEDVPVIVTTAHRLQDTPGAAAIVSKPIMPEALVPLIERLVHVH